MVQDVKDQRLKANHNKPQSSVSDRIVVQDVKDQRLKANHNESAARNGLFRSGSRCQRSKIESKSQLGAYALRVHIQWFKMSKIKD